jgi:hypothetical protein
LAYASNESGRYEVYIRGYPEGERLVVSTTGGNGPVWRRDGKELFFEGTNDGAPTMMAVSVAPDGTSVSLGKPAPLFEFRLPALSGGAAQYAGGGNAGTGYDVLPDGRFVMIRRADPAGTREIVLVQNFVEELKRLAPTK